MKDDTKNFKKFIFYDKFDWFTHPAAGFRYIAENTVKSGIFY